MSRRLVVVALLVSASAVAGCGGSSSHSSKSSAASQIGKAQGGSVAPVKPASSTPLARAALVSRANAICRRNTSRPTIKVRSAAEFDLALAQVTSYERAFYQELGRLAPPASLAGIWSQIVAAARTIADTTTALNNYPHALTNRSARPLFARMSKTRAELRTAAKSAGLSDCARA